MPRHPRQNRPAAKKRPVLPPKLVARPALRPQPRVISKQQHRGGR